MGPQKAVFQNPESAKMEISRGSPLGNSTGQPHMQVSPRTGISTWLQVSLGARFPKQQVKQKCFSDRLSAKTGKKHFVGYHFSSKKKHIVILYIISAVCRLLHILSHHCRVKNPESAKAPKPVRRKEDNAASACWKGRM